MSEKDDTSLADPESASRRPAASLPGFLLNATRDHPLLSCAVLLIIISGSVLLASGAGRLQVWIAVLAATAALLGFQACALVYNRQIASMLKAIESDSSPERVRQALPGSSINALDEIAQYHNRKALELLNVISTVQTNSDNLLERYRILTENLAASVVIRDLNSRIMYASPYTEVLTGYSISEIYAAEGDFFLQTVHEEDREKYERARRISAMGESFNLLYRARHKTGMEMWFETRTEPVMDEKNDIVSYLSVTIDVTRTMRYQKQVEEKNRDLQDFAYMVSHDLKAPIFTIKGMVNMLQEDLAGKMDSESLETFSHITKATQTLEKLVASVLEYSRISAQEARQEPVNLNAVFDDIINDHASQISQSGASVKIQPGLPQVIGDRLKIYQIFSNLVGNAIKFRDPSRSVIINISESKTRIERDVQISVSDNGLGIPADKLQSVFRPFHRAHGKKIEGSGIGLACVKRLLEKVGGSFEVSSIEGQGSIFTVTLRRLTE